MILRAKVKALEDMPPGALCCEKMKTALIAWGSRVIEVTTAKLKKSKCADCKASYMGMRVKGLTGWRIDPRAWEIEEGKINAC